jgi:hypothetical protein
MGQTPTLMFVMIFLRHRLEENQARIIYGIKIYSSHSYQNTFLMNCYSCHKLIIKSAKFDLCPISRTKIRILWGKIRNCVIHTQKCLIIAIHTLIY